MIELLIELGQLGALRHDGLAHEEGRLDGLISSLVHKLQGAVDECLIEQHPCSLQEVASTAGHLGSVVQVCNIQQLDQVHMVVLMARLLLTSSHCFDYCVVVLQHISCCDSTCWAASNSIIARS